MVVTPTPSSRRDADRRAWRARCGGGCDAWYSIAAGALPGRCAEAAGGATFQLVLNTGADCTLRTYAVGQALAAAALPQPGPLASNAGGAAPTILLDVALAFTTIDGRRVGLRGPIPALLDFSVLGRMRSISSPWPMITCVACSRRWDRPIRWPSSHKAVCAWPLRRNPSVSFRDSVYTPRCSVV